MIQQHKSKPGREVNTKCRVKSKEEIEKAGCYDGAVSTALQVYSRLTLKSSQTLITKSDVKFSFFNSQNSGVAK